MYRKGLNHFIEGFRKTFMKVKIRPRTTNIKIKKYS